MVPEAYSEPSQKLGWRFFFFCGNSQWLLALLWSLAILAKLLHRTYDGFVLEIYFGSQISVTTGVFELRIFFVRSSYQMALWPSGFGNCFICKRFAVQTLLWLRFVIQNKSRARHHGSLKLGSKLNCLYVVDIRLVLRLISFKRMKVAPQ